MCRGLVGLAIAAMVAAGCKTQPTGSGTSSPTGNPLSQAPLTGPAGSRAATSKGGDELANKPSAQLCLAMAENLEKEGKDADAIMYYEHARKLDSSLEEKAGRRLAVLYDQTDQQAKALLEFQALLKKKPKDAALLNDLGYSYYNRGQWSSAETYLAQAVAADKTNKRAWVNLGMTLAQLGWQAEAVSAFEKAVSPAEAQANLAFVLATQGNRTEALAAYRRALTLEPMHPVARAAMAKLEHTDGPASIRMDMPSPIRTDMPTSIRNDVPTLPRADAVPANLDIRMLPQ